MILWNTLEKGFVRCLDNGNSAIYDQNFHLPYKVFTISFKLKYHIQMKINKAICKYVIWKQQATITFFRRQNLPRIVF